MQVFNIGTDNSFPFRIVTEQDESNITFGFRLDNSFTLYDWFCVTLLVDGGNDTSIRLEWSESENSNTLIRMNQKLIPRCKAELPFHVSSEMMRLEKNFLAPCSALRKGGIEGVPTEKSKIGFVKITVYSKTLKEVVLYGSRLCEARPFCNLEGEKLVDRFGQSRVGEWTNKIHSEEELISYLRSEYEHAKDYNSYPEGWSKWGGWMKKRFNATGFFRIEWDNNRCWLVDPDGYAFFSNGICYGERAGIYCFTDEYLNLYEWLPDTDGEFAHAWSTAANIPQYIVRNGPIDAEKHRMFNFARANLIRAFGNNWHEAYTTITAARLRKMGFNTVGVGTNDYFDERTREFLDGAKIPYIVTFRNFPLTKERIFRDFPDVFSNEYRELCCDFARRTLKEYVGDPYMIGYFVTNEPEWLFARNVNLTERLLATDGCIESKRKFISWLRKKYADIVSLNSAWGTGFNSFEALLDKASVLKSEGAHTADFNEFEHELIKAYGSIVSDILHEVDPNHLNFGMRYSWMSEKTLGFDPEYFDVFSVNCYNESPRESAERIASRYKKPLVIGEWHIGAEESGLPSYGLRFTKTQAERAEACRYYAESSTQLSNLIGIHYFEYNDQPYFGRFDGECYQIGLSDVCHRQYDAVCDMFTEFACHMYQMLDGEIKPTAKMVKINRIN